eukprot:TRINITY_DN3022_c0_g4_i1.p1 TRINITY_DN3022_c0_g4~~TRINITY_DN3022_c0_g4_i1.p1  ORF type:complete len:721 (+),score=191.47 TRINITY_DN3022_c0_g4_i1:63-2165(+)
MHISTYSSIAVGITCSIVLSMCASKTVGGGDSGELLSVAWEGGVAHPPGYPLWVTLVWIVNRFGGTGGLVSGISGGLSVGFTHNTVLALTGGWGGAALIAALCQFLSPGMWRYSVHAEVFALNNLLCSILLNITLRYYTKLLHPTPTLLLTAFFSGLALANQQTSVIFIAPGGLLTIAHCFAFHSFPRKEKLFTVLFSALVLAAVIVVCYSQLVISSYFVQSENTWGAVFTIKGLLVHMLRMEYGTFSLANSRARYAKVDFMNTVTDYAAFTADQMPHVLLAVGIVGGIVGGLVFTRTRLTTSLLLVMWLCYILFFGKLTNLPLDTDLFRSVQERFWLQPYLLACIFVGSGMGMVQDVVDKLPVLRHVASDASIMVVAVSVAALHVTGNWEALDHSDNSIILDFAQTMLAPLDDDSILISKGDILTNSVRYARCVHNTRKDVHHFDLELMRAAWYVPRAKRHHKNVVFPGTSYNPTPGGFDALKFLNANSDRAVYLAYDLVPGDKQWQREYSKIPIGMADEFIRNTDLQEWSDDRHVKYMRDISKTFKSKVEEGVHRVTREPWEDLVIADYWASLFRMANFMVNKAEELQKQGVSRRAQIKQFTERALELLTHLQDNGKGAEPFVLSLCSKLLSRMLVKEMSLIDNPSNPRLELLQKSAIAALDSYIRVSRSLPHKKRNDKEIALMQKQRDRLEKQKIKK